MNSFLECARKWFIPILVLAALATAGIAGTTGYYIPSDVTRVNHTDYVLPTLDSPGTGFLLPATPTITLDVDTISRAGTMPTGAKMLKPCAFNGEVIYGDSGLTTATALLYPVIASGATGDWIPLGTSTPAVFFGCKTGTTPIVRLLVR